MGLVNRLARRNIFRNTRRTVLTIALIGCGLAALLFMDAYVRGAVVSMIKISTETFLGDAQVHRPGFREANDIDLYIEHPDKVYDILQRQAEVRAWSPRTLTGGMISSSENVTGGAIYGIDPRRESEVSKLLRAMRKGEYLSGKPGEILLGTEMADLLEVGLGDRIVVTVSQANGGELAQELFRVSGLFSFSDRHMDNGLAFINLQQGQQMLAIDGVHEIALRFDDALQADDTSMPLWQLLNNESLETLNWRELIPQLSGILEMSGFSTGILAVILYVLVSLGLINSMFMSIYERHYEFGVLLAIGTRPRQLFWQILLEGFFIGLLSVAAGLVVGAVLAFWFSFSGIDFGGIEMSGITLNDPIYPIVSVFSFSKLSLSILGITVLACVYPAIHAARLQPSYAMRKTL